MTDRQRIQNAIEEMIGFTGVALSRRSLGAMLERFLKCTDEQVGYTLTITEFNDYLTDIAQKAREMAEKPEQWTKNNRVVFTSPEVQAQSDDTFITLSQTLMRLDAAYGDQFRIDGALDYLNGVASGAEKLKRALSK